MPPSAVLSIGAVYVLHESSLGRGFCLCRDRIRDWVRQTSNLEPLDDDDDPDELLSPRKKGAQPSRFGRAQPDADGAVHVHIPAHHASAGKDTFKGMPEGSESEGGPEAAARYPAGSGAGSMPDGMSDVGSLADGMSDAGSSIESTAVGAMGHDEELAVDMRCGCVWAQTVWAQVAHCRHNVKQLFS